MTVGATSGGETASPVEYAYVVGVPIPNGEITNRLIALYRGATPGLLAKIAMVESSYRQFSNRTLLGLTARWSTESAGNGGAFVGLMQVPLSMTNAWDWQTNTETGTNIFAEKLRFAKSVERKLRKQYSGIRSLTGVELENIALLLYGGWARLDDLNKQYYIPQRSGNGVEWVVNTANNPDGVAYVDKVRALLVP